LSLSISRTASQSPYAAVVNPFAGTVFKAFKEITHVNVLGAKVS